MLNALIRGSLENRPLVLAIAAGVLAWGGFALSRLPVDVLPDLAAPTVTVIAEHVGLAPVDMEQLVTLPIESAVSGVAGVRRVRSATAVGACLVWVEFDWGEDIYRARQLVTERLGSVERSLPPGTSPPTIGPVTSYVGEILFIALTSDSRTPAEIRAMADTDVRRRLLAVPGVAQVTPIGGGRKQYEVVLSAERLAAHRIAFAEVRDALSAGSANTSAGFLVQGGREYLIRGVGTYLGLDDIRDTVIRTTEGVPVRVRDLATVRTGESLRRGAAALDGAPAVVVGVSKQPEVNTLELTAEVDRAIDDLRAVLPSDIEIRGDIFRQADFIELAVGNLEEAARYGGLLVVVAVLVFLANARASMITLLAIPISLVGAVLGMAATGLTINGMTIGGLAIALGELVDDAVVDVENVVRRLGENGRLPDSERRPALEVVYRASSEIRGPVAFATLVVILVFAPLLFLGGIEGPLLRPLGFAYAVALFSSLIVALTVTPVLCSYLLARRKSALASHESVTIRFLRRIYQPVLAWSLDRGALVLAASGLTVVVAVASFGSMGRAFLPEFREDTLTITAVTLPGTSLDESDRLGAALERAVLNVPEIVSTVRRTGRGEQDQHMQGVESSEIDVKLVSSARPRDAVVEEIRQRASLVPGTRINVGQPISHRIDHMLSGTRASVAVKIFGADLATLRALAERVEQAISRVRGVVDLSSEQQAEVPTASVRFRRDDLARYGLPAAAAAEALKAVFLGVEVGSVREDQVAFPLVVRFEGGRPDDIRAIREAVIDTPSGARIPFSTIADIREDRSPNVVMRESVQRRITVSCNISGRDLHGFVEEVRERIEEDVDFPQGYRVEYGGQYESQVTATRRIAVVSALVLIGIGVLLATAFRSARDAVLTLLNLPFALVGGVVGVFLSGGVLSVASLIGFITLFGVSTRNGILLVSHIKRIAAEDGRASLRGAIVRGATERLAPILMTATSTGLALVPIAAGLGEAGSELHAPLAIVVLCGLVTATAMNMLVVPVAYLKFGRLQATDRPALGAPRH